MRAHKNRVYNAHVPASQWDAFTMRITSRLAELRKSEHSNTVQIIEGLVICQRERAYLPLGYSSIWTYLREGLKYSPAAASRRYKAMKCAMKHPQVIDMLRDHRVSLSTLAKAESLLSQSKNAEDLLDQISGRSQVQVERIVAKERPRPTKPREKVSRVAVKHDDPLFTEHPEPTESRVSVRTTLTEKRFDAFEEARAIITRKCPGASVEDVLNELVDQYLKARKPRTTKKLQGKRAARLKTRSRHISRSTRDEVMLRDDERCTFVGEGGHRCTERHDLQIDHVQPWALGGTQEPRNLRVMCAAHNRHRARETFGPPPQRE